MNDVQLTLIVIGLVALSRRVVPRIDGVYVAFTAVFFAALASVIAAPCSLPAAFVRGVVSGLTAFGAMTAVRYAARKLAERNADTGDAIPATTRTGASEV